MADIGQMLQAIVSLGQLQNQRREQNLREQQFEEGKKQFAQSFGLQEGDQRFRELSKAIDVITSSSDKARGAATSMFSQLLGDPRLGEYLGQYATGMPMTQDMLRTIAANEGVAAQTPDQRGAMNAEAASGVVTGMNQGQAASSGVVNAALGGGQVAPGTFAPNTTSYLQQGLAGRTATGQDPLAYNIGRIITQNPAMLQTLSKIQAGQAITESERQNIGVAMAQVGATIRGQDVGAQVGMYGHNIQAMLGAGQLGLSEFTARQGMAITPQTRLDAIGKMQGAITSSQNAKTKGEMQSLTAMYNAAVTTGFPERAFGMDQGGLLITDPQQLKKPEVLDKITALMPHAIGQGQGYTQGPPPSPFQPAPTNPPFTPSYNFQASPYLPQQLPPQVAQPFAQGAPAFSMLQYLQSMPQYQPPQAPQQP